MISSVKRRYKTLVSLKFVTALPLYDFKLTDGTMRNPSNYLRVDSRRLKKEQDKSVLLSGWFRSF